MIFFFISAHPVISQPGGGKKNFHLYMLAGQSNMAGRGEIEAEDKTTYPQILVLNKANEWQPATEPLHFDKPDITGVGPGLSFAKKMTEIDSNIVIGLIPCAVGGSAINFWQPSKFYEPTKSYPYDDAIARTKFAMQKGNLKGILWQQGESDSDSIKAKLYAGNLKSLVERFRYDLNLKDLPFVAGTLPEFYIAKRPYAKIINEAIILLPNSVPNTAVVYSSGLHHKGDDTHFNSASARLLGERYAAVYQTLFKNQ
ncbi:MAG: sialate O-acetylesterase [Chitinophagaceae bacterium]|nr:sialate O-acetylesterase [Chitinophagaceae bacterium]